MSDLAEKMRAARERIARPDGWIKYASARDADGEEVSSFSEEATRFCSVGAINAAYGQRAYFDDEEYVAKKLLRDVIGGEQIDRWNDAKERTQAEVVAAFDRAIALAEAEERA